jgi:CRISPR-associated Csx2 family protein
MTGMAKILISSLGTGSLDKNNISSREYRKAVYRFEGTGKEYETSFVATALSEHLQVDKIYLVGTSKSMWEEVYNYFSNVSTQSFNESYWAEIGEKVASFKSGRTKINENDLENVNKAIDGYLKYLKSTASGGSHCYVIDYGLNEAELWSNFDVFMRIGNNLNANDEIFLDITHSFRSIPLFNYLMLDLIGIIDHDRTEIINQKEKAFADMVDYYTIWAHQIKTPIAAMRLLLQSEQSETNSELLEQLFKVEQYVEMVLQYLRLENMSSDLVFKRHSLDDIVKQAIRKYSKSFIRKKIKLNYMDLNCDVLTDEKWLVFVVEQILSNALKYTGAGEISIYMDSRLLDTLVIEDTGIGIEQEDLPRVFEKGFTGYIGRSDKRSTGIGLFLCKQILNKMSHTITIESVVGKGTKVKIGLDVADIAAD